MSQESNLKPFIDEINSNWDEVAIRYDDFRDMYEPVDDAESQTSENLREMMDKKHLQNTFKYALSRKQEPPPRDRNPEEVLAEAFKTQRISHEHMDTVTQEVKYKQTLIQQLDEATVALEAAISRYSRPKEVQDTERKDILKLVKKDFMKQQKYFMTAVQKVFLNYQKEAHLVLNKLFDAHFESVDKFIDVSNYPEVVVQRLVQAFLVDCQHENPNMMKLRSIL